MKPCFMRDYLNNSVILWTYKLETMETKIFCLRETSSSSSVIFWKNTQKMTVAFPCRTSENSCLTKTISLYSLRLNRFVFSYILLFNQINQSILGGLVVEFGQKLFDMSIRTRAKQMEKFLRDPVNFDNL